MTPKQILTSANQDWQTPPDLFNWVHAQCQFTLDAAASFQNALCPKFYTEEDNGLLQNWDNETVWCNPPYGTNQPAWAEKAAATNHFVALLIPARTDTKMWHEQIFPKASCVIFLKGRLKFSRPGTEGQSSTFPSALVIYSSWKPMPVLYLTKLQYVAAQLGHCVLVTNKYQPKRFCTVIKKEEIESAGETP